MLPATLLTLGALALLVLAEAREHEPTKRLTKPLASAGFVGVAIAAGAFHGSYGQAVLVALLLSWVGDVCLLSKRDKWFLAGLAAFLLAHVAFGAAFWIHGIDGTWAAGAAIVLAGIALLVRRWLMPTVQSGMRRPVDAYIGVITVMVALAIGATAAGGSPRIAIGAIAFFLSDLAVARERFVHSALSNRLWGLPLYYGAQLLLASSIAA